MKSKEKNEKKPLKDFNPAEALRIAMYVEEEGARFYKELTSRTKDKQIRNELQFLWNEEESHRSNFEKLLRKRDEGENANIKDEDKIAILINQGIFGPIKKLRTEDILCDNAEALKLGIVIKRRMISYFRSLLEETKDPDAKLVVDDIIRQEERHLDRLNLLLAY